MRCALGATIEPWTWNRSGRNTPEALVAAPLPASAKGEVPAIAAGSASVAGWLAPSRSVSSDDEAAHKRNLARALDTRHGRGT